MYVNICCLERKRKSVDRLNCNFVAAFFRFLFYIVINDENVLKLPEPYECTCTNVFFSHWNEIECSVHSIAMHVFEHVKKKKTKKTELFTKVSAFIFPSFFLGDSLF